MVEECSTAVKKGQTSKNHTVLQFHMETNNHLELGKKVYLYGAYSL